MSVEPFPEAGKFTMVAEVIFDNERAATTYYIEYDLQTTIKDILEEGASTLNLDIDDYELYIEYPVGFPGIDLQHQIDELQYVKLPVCLNDDKFVTSIRCAQIMAMAHPNNTTIATELASRKYIYLYKIYIAL